VQHRFIQESIAALRRRDTGLLLSGASSHAYVLNPPLSEADVAQFETIHGIRLPEDYRDFLVHVGNGGAGPRRGVLKLGEMRREEHWMGADTGALREPWPHRTAWNTPPEELEVIEALPGEARRVARDAHDKKYWDEALTAGALPLCDHGEGLRDWLVVSGPEAGTVWHDGRARGKGLLPYEPEGHHWAFEDWYLSWLNHALLMFKVMFTVHSSE
jgi:SMI1/KNR4 family protein SUKH-1